PSARWSIQAVRSICVGSFNIHRSGRGRRDRLRRVKAPLQRSGGSSWALESWSADTAVTAVATVTTGVTSVIARRRWLPRYSMVGVVGNGIVVVGGMVIVVVMTGHGKT